MCAPLQPPGAPARGVNGWAHREGEWQSAPHRQGSDEVAIAGRAMAYRASATVAFATAVASARVGAAAAARAARVPKTRMPCMASTRLLVHNQGRNSRPPCPHSSTVKCSNLIKRSPRDLETFMCWASLMGRAIQFHFHWDLTLLRRSTSEKADWVTIPLRQIWRRRRQSSNAPPLRRMHRRHGGELC